MVQKNHTGPYLSKFTYSCSARQNPLVESAALTACPDRYSEYRSGHAVKSAQISHLRPVCDRVGRGEWSRVYDACMVVRVYLSGLRAPCMPRRCLRRLETRHPYHLGGVFWYGSSISIIIYLSLIRGISSVADGENKCYRNTVPLLPCRLQQHEHSH